MDNNHEPVASVDAIDQTATIDSYNTVSMDAASDTMSRLSKSQGELFASLIENWQNHTVNDLEARHRLGSQFGKLLEMTSDENGCLPVGLHLDRPIAECLWLLPFELYQVLLFTKEYPQFEAFREEYPEVYSWTQARQEVLSIPKRLRRPIPSGRVPVPSIEDSIYEIAGDLNCMCLVAPSSEFGEALYRTVQLLITEVNRLLGTDFVDRSSLGNH